MDDLRKERLVIGITTLAAIACIVLNFLGGWEFWVPAVIVVGDVTVWWFHIAQKLDQRSRINMCFAFAAFLVFYHGIHATSIYDVSIVVTLFMGTFTVANNIRILNLVLVEYALVMGIQFYFLYTDSEQTGAYTTLRIAFHVGAVLCMYLFSRITVNGRLAEKGRIQEWMQKVNENNHDMDDFLSNISHELRTPVNVISGMTTILQKDDDREELESIQEAGIRLAHQIEDIQDYTEIKRGQLVLEEENYMCISLINDVIANYKTKYAREDLEFIIDIAPQTPSMLKGDIKKIHKVFRHLLENAVKFTRRGGIYIKVFCVSHDAKDNLTIEITDTGIGMTRADMSRVSKGMYQANKKRNRSTGGIGIGLPIVYGFVHAMGGFVNIQSSKGSGTTVRISIPQQVVDHQPCLIMKDKVSEGMVFYIKPEKYKVPEVREFYREMAINLATGLKAKLYSAGDTRELEKLVGELPVSHIFTGQEEYEADRKYLDELAAKGYSVVVSASAGFISSSANGVTVMPKPLYAFPVVRIINGEYSEQENDKDKLSLEGLSALIVDDEPMNLVVASGLFKEYKMKIDTAESGKEAIEKYDNGDYDVIFMDHMMPEMDGVEAMKRIRQIAEASYRKPFIIALTANALSGARDMFMREGFDGFIAKPISIAEFEHVMRNILPEDTKDHEGRDEK